MRHVVQGGERGTTLEVDQNEVELLRGVAGRQRRDERPQHFRLTGTGRPDQQAVWPHTALSSFLKVDIDDAAIGTRANGDLQELLHGFFFPVDRWVKLGHVGNGKKFRDFHHLVKRSASPVVGIALISRLFTQSQSPGCQLAGDAFGLTSGQCIWFSEIANPATLLFPDAIAGEI